MYKRVLVKLSGEALGNDGKGFNDEKINKIVNELVEIVKKGTQVSLVIGGGNFWRGRSSGEMDRTKADQIGMLATVMNAMYVSDTFNRKGIKCTVMTPFNIEGITKRFDKNETIEKLENGEVCIFAGGVGHPYFSTDTITALRAVELSCDVVLYAKNVDGIYDSDPNKNTNAKKYDTITYSEIIKKDLKAIDISAMNLSMENNITSLVFGLKEGSIKKVISGENIGTKVVL